MKLLYHIISFLTFLQFISCRSNNKKNHIEVSGNIEALSSTLISSKISGEVLDILK